MFFPPCFRSDAEITIWGPSSPEASLEDRVASLHLGTPVARGGARASLLGRVPRCARDRVEWIGDVLIRAEAVTHRGPDARLPDHRW